MRNKKGMSLIVLVITILVMIILASVVVVSLVDNNPIDVANEAIFKNDLASFKHEYMLELNNRKVNNKNFKFSSINALGVEINEYISSFTKSYYNKIQIINGELFYIGDKDYEKKWASAVGYFILGESEIPKPEEEQYTDEYFKIGDNKIEVGGNILTITIPEWGMDIPDGFVFRGKGDNYYIPKNPGQYLTNDNREQFIEQNGLKLDLTRIVEVGVTTDIKQGSIKKVENDYYAYRPYWNSVTDNTNWVKLRSNK